MDDGGQLDRPSAVLGQPFSRVSCYLLEFSETIYVRRERANSSKATRGRVSTATESIGQRPPLMR